MPSTDRRAFLAALGTAGTAALAGCSAFTTSAADVDSHTGLDDDASAHLDGIAVYLAGDTDTLPEPPTTTESLADAEVVLGTTDATRATLVSGFRSGATVALVETSSKDERPSDGVQDAFAAFLEADGTHQYGTETVLGRPVSVAAAVPRGDTASTYVFPDEGGWDDSVLDPVGWVEHGRLPDCRTFVPESSADDDYEYAGDAFIVGRLETGETYASRTRATVRTFEDHERRVRLRTTMHAAANDGYPVADAHRVADFPNDDPMLDQFPNPHERNGVEVHNRSGLVDQRLDVEFRPTNDRARGALTACCGLTTGGDVGYDHETRWTWTDDGFVTSDSHYGGASGRGEWHLDG